MSAIVTGARLEQLVRDAMAEQLARDIDELTIKSIIRSVLRSEFMGRALGLLAKSRKLKKLADLRNIERRHGR